MREVLEFWRLKFNGSVVSSFSFCSSLTAQVISLENALLYLEVRLFPLKLFYDIQIVN